VKSYLWNAEKTFVTTPLTPYYTNPRKELTKAPTYCFNDLGFLNYAAAMFGAQLPEQRLGFVFQGLVWRILRERTRFLPFELHYWRTKDKAEVDFAIQHGEAVTPVEVKFARLTKPSFDRSFRSFLDRYEPEQAWVVNRALSAERVVGSTTVRFLPYWRLLDAALP